MVNLKTLKFGMTSTHVQLLQLALMRAGFLPEQPDGSFGARTLAGVKAFQKSNGLTVDGVVGKNTWTSLYPFLTGYRIHSVKSGDTLFKLAVRYGASLNAIQTANPNVNAQNLLIGSKLTIPLPFSVVPDSVAFTSTLLEIIRDGLTARYPFIKSGIAGYSVIGRPIYYFSVPGSGGEVFYNASHHANEWITSTLLMTFLEKYAATNRDGNRTLFMIPLVNPDGVDLVTGEISDGAYYTGPQRLSADYPGIPFPSGWKANILGIDPNLQYPAGWDEAKRIKFAQGYVSPSPRDYVGKFPLEAPESRAVYDFTLKHDFRLTLSYHTQGKVIYWKYLDYEPENSRKIAEELARLSGYTAEITPTGSGYAGYKDWFIMKYNRPSYTIEAGAGSSPLPLSQFPEIYRDNIGILMSCLSNG